MPRVDAVLFDLDGTLIDSAPDLAAAANEQRDAHGLDAVPYEALRRMVGSGARGMVGVAFGVKPGEPRYDTLRRDFLQRYERRLLVLTQVFAAMQPVLQRLHAHRLPWGIVTNKALRLATPIVEGLGLHHAAALIGGDSTPFTKPHPEPLLEAARRLGVAPQRCAYVGDDVRDMRAGRAAGMACLAAAWGYLGNAEPIEDWGADLVLPAPGSLLHWLELA